MTACDNHWMSMPQYKEPANWLRTSTCSKNPEARNVFLFYFWALQIGEHGFRPVLMGCLGGMGLFLFSMGLGTASSVAWEWNVETFLEQGKQWPKLVSRHFRFGVYSCDFLKNIFRRLADKHLPSPLF